MNAAESESVQVTRRIAAPPERVFEAWVDASLLRRWLAPIAESEARLGGHFRLEVSKQDATHVVTGEYREFVPGQRLIMTWEYEGPMAPAGKMRASLSVEFRKEGPDTEIHLQHDGLTSPQYYEAINRGAWVKALDGLEAILTNRSAKSEGA